jgi:hypothetical protein
MCEIEVIELLSTLDNDEYYVTNHKLQIQILGIQHTFRSHVLAFSFARSGLQRRHRKQASRHHRIAILTQARISDERPALSPVTARCSSLVLQHILGRMALEHDRARWCRAERSKDPHK